MGEFIIDTADKLACAQRELTMRRRVYPRWVETGRMTQAKMDFEIRIMSAIVADYERQVQGERLL